MHMKAHVETLRNIVASKAVFIIGIYVPIRTIKRDNNTIETHNTNKKDII